MIIKLKIDGSRSANPNLNSAYDFLGIFFQSQIQVTQVAFFRMVRFTRTINYFQNFKTYYLFCI